MINQKRKVDIIDNVLDETEIQDIIDFKVENHGWMYWCNIGDNTINDKILNKCAEFYDLTNISGYSFWSNELYGKCHEWHYDADDAVKKTNNFPIFTAIFYFAILNLKGGKLLTENKESITPENNRLVILPGGTLHYVESYQGSRNAIMLSPWNERPLESHLYKPLISK